MRQQMASEIRMMRFECSRDIEQLRGLKDYERLVDEIDAKRAWLDGLDSCGLCHGTGVRLEAVPEDPVMIRDDGMVKVRRFFGGEHYGTIYEGYEPYDFAASPQTKEVFCEH